MKDVGDDIRDDQRISALIRSRQGFRQNCKAGNPVVNLGIPSGILKHHPCSNSCFNSRLLAELFDSLVPEFLPLIFSHDAPVQEMPPKVGDKTMVKPQPGLSSA